MSAWISVRATMPAQFVDVLVYGRKNGMEIRYEVAGLFDGEWMSQATQGFLKFVPTHWMPLPEPPK